ncbi:hypothetical protein [Castellaniella sp.]|uniref:MmyB family transcriptional regulator n=1 Tax=Castellaniella sp. TaxID=1955812 RepID=UPI002AFE9BC0|nr:hypothetical protein [Castellaniella sp.]
MANARDAIEMILKGHEPFPALAVDRHWNLIMANDALTPFLADVEDQALLTAPVNVLRLSLHPGGLAPRDVLLSEIAIEAFFPADITSRSLLNPADGP